MKNFFVFTSAVLLLIIVSSILYANFFTNFQDSARAGNTARVRKLMDSNKDTVTRIKALNYAVLFNRTDTAAFLLDYVSPNNAVTTVREPHISIASRNGNNDIVKLLIDKGANLGSAFDKALLNGNYDTAEILLNNGANPNTPFFINPNLKPNPKIISLIMLMIDKGADIKGDFGSNALIVAVKLKNYDFINTLLNKGASIHLSEALGNAAMAGDKEMITFLIEKGAVIDKNTLLYTLMSNRTELFKYLLDISTLQKSVSTLDSGLLSTAIFQDDLEAAKTIIEKGVSYNPSSKKYTPPLIIAVQTMNPEIVKLLLENGASAKGTDSMGRSPVEIINSIREHDLDWFDIGHKEDCRKILELLKKYDKQ